MNSKDIKFRYYDEVLRRMVYSDEWQASPNCFLNISSFFDWASRYAKGRTIQQYTGAKTINGREIYEGDIMASRGNYITDEIDKNGNFPDLYNVVIWSAEQTRFGLIPTNKFGKSNEVWACDLTTFREIIGNIFQNPELLK